MAGDTPMSQLNQPAVLQMKITLIGVTPPVWRRFQISSAATFYELHRALQIVMGWRNYHLYLFNVNGTELSDPATMLELGIKNAEQICLEDLLHDIPTRFRYEYDFGDRWDHDIELELRIEGETRPYPICLAGESACPPEGSGGSRGYARFRESLGERT
ncbi:MAG: plasmid pRiA4b ORF-3 family protein, partial [Ardenticatenaceae bacterium]|nr:plasmid pRiA4b ORF-3 family protein [Ardenticatenaceae bacterium]